MAVMQTQRLRVRVGIALIRQIAIWVFSHIVFKQLVFEQRDRCQQWLHALPISVDQLRQFAPLSGIQLLAKITLYMHQHVGVITPCRLECQHNASRRRRYSTANASSKSHSPILATKRPSWHTGLRMRQQRQLVAAMEGDQTATGQPFVPQHIQVVQCINSFDKVFPQRYII